ncbi:hypothetical protein VNI00_008033 [Paramarasmius palmivorus]|uniref:Uncharacterized protein n=1 Tax=Paramarasmius palmivorus TaxID=297713 RepID=A0AAW0CXC3_9AGAR
MSAIFGEWRFAMWKHLTQLDVECYCIDSGSFYSSSGEGTGMYIWAASRPQIQDAYSRNGIKLLLCHQYWSAKAASPSLDLAGLNQLFKSIQEANLQEVSGLRFVIPFPIAEALWRHPNPVVRKESLQLLPLFEEAWQHSPALEESRHDSDRLAFIVALTEHLRTDCISELTRRRRGLEFIRYVHGHIITRRLYQYDPKRRYQLYDQKRRRRLLVSDWVDAITKAHHVYNEQVPNNKRLPPDFFAPIPPPIEPLPIDIPPASVSPSGVRYSSDTVIDIVNGEVQVVDINEDPNGTEFIRLHAAASLPPTEMVNSTMEDAWQESKPPSAGGVEGLG